MPEARLGAGIRAFVQAHRRTLATLRHWRQPPRVQRGADALCRLAGQASGASGCAS
jgi:hypothetical protein